MITFARELRAPRPCALAFILLALLATHHARAAEGIPKTPPDVAVPSPAQREVLFRSLLAKYCRELAATPDKMPIPVKLGRWPALQVPTASVLGIVLIGEGNTRTKGPHRATLDKLYKYVAQTASRREVSTDHESWMLSLAILFLSEVHNVEPSPSLKSRITDLVKRLETGRQGEKGWYHSLKSTSYGPFVGVTIWCTAALSAAAEQGIDVDAKGLAAARRGLLASIGKSGGAYYFTYKHNSYSTPGRTGGVLWALTRYDRPADADEDEDEKDKIANARAFILRNAESAPNGHASWMMNLAWAALGASCGDIQTHNAFWDVHRATIFKTRDTKAFFKVQKWTEEGFRDGRKGKVALGDAKTWPDPMYGDAWATVWMFLVWQVERRKCILARDVPGLTVETIPADPTTTIDPTAPKDPKAPTAPAHPQPLPAGALDDAAIAARIALIKQGKGAAMRNELYTLMKRYPNDARLYLLRAYAFLPPLLDPFPYKTPTQKFPPAWNPAAESAALRDLTTALAKRAGKGDIPDEFDGKIHWLRAKIHAKRALALFKPDSVAWAADYNTFGKEIKAMLKKGHDTEETYQTVKALNTFIRTKLKKGQ